MKYNFLSYIFLSCTLTSAPIHAQSGVSGAAESTAQVKLDLTPASGTVRHLSDISLNLINGRFTSPGLSSTLHLVNPDGSLSDPISSLSFSSKKGAGLNHLSISSDQMDESVLSPGLYAIEIPASNYIVSSVQSDNNCGENIPSEIPESNSGEIINDYMIANPAVNFDGPTFRVLDIGNSFTMNSTEYLRQLIPALGVDVSDICFYRTTFSGGSFKDWYDLYMDLNTESPYYIQRVFGDIRCNNLPELPVYTGREGIRALLEDNEWDLIIIHQASRYACYYDVWGSQEDGGYLNELLEVIHKLQPDVPVGTHLIHGYGRNSGSNSEKFTTPERWGCISSSVKRMMDEADIKLLIPYGTAIENLRAGELNDEEDLLEDGTHLSTGLARYTAACCYYETVFAPRFKKSMVGNSLRIEGANDVTEENAPAAWAAARSACEHPFRITSPDGKSAEELVTENSVRRYFAYVQDPEPVNLTLSRPGDSNTIFQALPGKPLTVSVDLDDYWVLRDATLLRWLNMEQPDDNRGIDLHTIVDDDPLKEFEAFPLKVINHQIIVPGELTDKDGIISLKVELANPIQDAISIESGVKEIQGVNVFVGDSKAFFHGLTPGDEICIYSPAGHILKNMAAYSENMEFTLEKGVYIVRVNDWSLKIIL